MVLFLKHISFTKSKRFLETNSRLSICVEEVNVIIRTLDPLDITHWQFTLFADDDTTNYRYLLAKNTRLETLYDRLLK